MNSVQAETDLWEDLAKVVCNNLSLDIENLKESQR